MMDLQQCAYKMGRFNLNTIQHSAIRSYEKNTKAFKLLFFIHPISIKIGIAFPSVIRK